MSGTVLITGAGGFLAGHCAREFAGAGWRTVGVGRSDPNRQAGLFAVFHLNDLTAPERIAPILEAHGPDVVIHLAAPASVASSLRNPPADFHGQVDPAVALLEGVRVSASAARVLLVSSAAVYGNPAALPVSESAALAPISPYGFHKVHQELLFREYQAVHGVRTSVARVFSTYGENLRRLAAWDIARRALSGSREVLGRGDETRDYLYAGDLACALRAIAENGAFEGEAVNVGSGEQVSIRALAVRIFELLGMGGEPSFTGVVPTGNPSNWQADTTALAALGAPQFEWSRGLARTIEWIRQA